MTEQEIINHINPKVADRLKTGVLIVYSWHEKATVFQIVWRLETRLFHCEIIRTKVVGKKVDYPSEECASFTTLEEAVRKLAEMIATEHPDLKLPENPYARRWG